MTVTPMKRITLRVPSSVHHALTQLAAKRHVSLNTLALEALQRYIAQEKRRFPFKELSDVLVPAAQAQGLTEEEIQHQIKEMRRRLWQERYQDMVEASPQR
ncbi:MAG: toxin-antitoxin system HicB family antitoxin [Nitrospinota bacterium]|nr:MAG: toxin-antitoxin system HicB family antitoxin [Nitrospinota bacterium]